MGSNPPEGQDRHQELLDLRDLLDRHFNDAGRQGAGFGRAYEAVLGKPARFEFLTGIADANITVAEGGIPTIMFGPDGDRAHECNEYAEIGSLAPVAEVLARSCISYWHSL